MNSIPLFVYGTLRRGCSNDIVRLIPQAHFIAAAQVRGTLYLVSWYPHLILDALADWVSGELYEVPAFAWQLLDTLEDIVSPAKPDGEYFRRETLVQAATGDALAAIIYEGNLMVLPTHTRIAHGDWVRYARENNLSRIPPDTR